MVELGVFKNPADLTRFSREVYAEAQRRLIERGGKGLVTETSKFCSLVNPTAAEMLTKMGLRVRYHEHEDIYGGGRGCVSHAFLEAEHNGRLLLDWQYQQFIPENQRIDLPPALILPFSSRQDIVSGLTRHKVLGLFYGYWLEELFHVYSSYAPQEPREPGYRAGKSLKAS